MKRRWLVITPLLCLAACSIPSDQPARKKAPPSPVVKVADESRRFTSENRVKIDFVEDHLLGKDYLPGGNLAEYKQGENSYQQFLTRVETPDKAAFLLVDFRNDLTDAKYLAHMGGYFGHDGDQPVLVFQKGRSLAGVIGLPEKEADMAARVFAAALD